jgi:hypothetical protein
VDGPNLSRVLKILRYSNFLYFLILQKWTPTKFSKGAFIVLQPPFEMAVVTWSCQRAQIVILNGGWHNRHLKQRLKAQPRVVARVYSRPLTGRSR